MTLSQGPPSEGPSGFPEEITEVHSVDQKWTFDREESALLVLLDGPERGRAIRLDKSSTIGRGAEADVVVRDPALSRVHARLVRDAEKYYIEDLGSRNGTFVGSERVYGRRALPAGSRLTLGRTLGSFTLSGALEAELAVGVHELARRDPLTGLYNRGIFEERLETEFAYSARNDRPVGVLLVDLDHFKKVNDEYGHQAGDAVLRVVANALQRVVRRYDLVARYGGEELAIVARDITERNAEILGGRVRASIRSLRIPWRGQVMTVTASVGVAVYDARFPTPAALVAAADAALYEAKRNGRDRVVRHLSGAGQRTDNG
jgi:diguanylate cyclase (GGDEF)-like protein